MVVYLETSQLATALQRIKSWKDQAPYSWRLIGCMYSEIETKSGHTFVVDLWPEFSSVCVIPQRDCKYWFFFDVVSKDGQHENNFLSSFIFNEELWKSSKGMENATIHWSYRETDILQQLCDRKGLINKEDKKYTMFICDEDHLIPQHLPDCYTLTCLTAHDTDVVFKFWEYAQEGNTEFVRLHLENFPGVAIRDCEGNLVAWYVALYIGEMGMLHVLPEHRGKGLAKFVAYALGRKLIEMDRNLYCYIDRANISSVRVHEKCGFWMAHDCDTYLKALPVACQHK